MYINVDVHRFVLSFMAEDSIVGNREVKKATIFFLWHANNVVKTIKRPTNPQIQQHIHSYVYITITTF